MTAALTAVRTALPFDVKTRSKMQSFKIPTDKHCYHGQHLMNSPHGHRPSRSTSIQLAGAASSESLNRHTFTGLNKQVPGLAVQGQTIHPKLHDSIKNRGQPADTFRFSGINTCGSRESLSNLYRMACSLDNGSVCKGYDSLSAENCPSLLSCNLQPTASIASVHGCGQASGVKRSTQRGKAQHQARTGAWRKKSELGRILLDNQNYEEDDKRVLEEVRQILHQSGEVNFGWNTSETLHDYCGTLMPDTIAAASTPYAAPPCSSRLETEEDRPAKRVSMFSSGYQAASYTSIDGDRILCHELDTLEDGKFEMPCQTGGEKYKPDLKNVEHAKPLEKCGEIPSENFSCYEECQKTTDKHLACEDKEGHFKRVSSISREHISRTETPCCPSPSCSRQITSGPGRHLKTARKIKPQRLDLIDKIKNTQQWLASIRIKPSCEKMCESDDQEVGTGVYRSGNKHKSQVANDELVTKDPPRMYISTKANLKTNRKTRQPFTRSTPGDKRRDCLQGVGLEDELGGGDCRTKPLRSATRSDLDSGCAVTCMSRSRSRCCVRKLEPDREARILSWLQCVEPLVPRGRGKHRP